MDRSKRFASTEKAREELGFVAKVDIEEGIRATVEWTKENYKRIEESINKHEKMLSQMDSK